MRFFCVCVCTWGPRMSSQAVLNPHVIPHRGKPEQKFLCAIIATHEIFLMGFGLCSKNGNVMRMKRLDWFLLLFGTSTNGPPCALSTVTKSPPSFTERVTPPPNNFFQTPHGAGVSEALFVGGDGWQCPQHCCCSSCLLHLAHKSCLVSLCLPVHLVSGRGFSHSSAGLKPLTKWGSLRPLNPSRSGGL